MMLNYSALNLKVFFESKNLRARAFALGSRIKHKKRPLSLASNGPIEVLKSIQLGLILEQNQIEAFPKKTNWVLSGQIPNRVLEDQPQDSILLLGPNVEFHELNIALLVKKFSNLFYLVPSAWVVPVLARRLDIPESNIIVWPCGIDTKTWSTRNPISTEALVYVKGDKDQRYSDASEYLHRAGIKFNVIQYGEYSQKIFRKALEKSKFAIWIGGTESQGIALMESWAMNVPTFVFRRDSYFDPVTQQTFQASSAPYLNEFVGRFSESEDFDARDLEKFIADLESFRPRENILKHLELSNALINLRNQVSTLVT